MLVIQGQLYGVMCRHLPAVGICRRAFLPKEPRFRTVSTEEAHSLRRLMSSFVVSSRLLQLANVILKANLRAANGY